MSINSAKNKTYVDSEGHVSVASVSLEAFLFELNGDQGDMGVVHRLQVLD